MSCLRQPDQNGYTLIELIMAMALFSGMLLIISIGFIAAVRMYRGGLSSRESQTATGYGVEEILRDIRAAYNADPPVAGGTPQLPRYRLCLHLVGRDILYRINGSALSRYSNCAGSGAVETISSSTVNVLAFKAVVNTPSTNTQSVTVTLLGVAATGITDSAGTCNNDIQSGLCATSSITSTASLRGRQGDE